MQAARRVAAAVVLALLLGLVWAGPADAASGLIVWAPEPQADILRAQLVNGFRGEPVTVVTKDIDAIRADLQTVDLDEAPDVIWADAAWTGELVAARIAKRLPLSETLRGSFPPNLLDAFRYGFADYGVPVSFANEALVVNLDLVGTPPATFRDVERQSRRLLASKDAVVGIAVGQGEVGSEHLLGPLFTGLGGYLFGKNAAGGLDPYNLGIAGPAFLANADRIDAWNAAGLLDASLDPVDAERVFARGRAPYWLTGSWSLPAIESLSFDVAIIPVPPVVDGIVPTPFLSVAGAMVTVYADRHGAGELAAALVRRHFGAAKVQAALARAAQAAPALAEARVSRAIVPFALSGTGGTPMPNIVQAAQMWGPFAQAWARSTAGGTAVPAQVSFPLAARAYLAAVG